MRITRHRLEIAAGLERYPKELLDRVPLNFWTDDPVFTGLHPYEAMVGGRSYRNTAHVAYPEHQAHLPKDRRQPVIVLPERLDDRQPIDVRTVVHEVAHVLDWATGFQYDLPAINWYAERNRREAFAEVITAWLMPDFDDSGWLDSDPLDGDVIHLLEGLCA